MKQTKEECVITAAMNIILHAGNARNILRDAGKCIAEGKNLDAIAQQLEEARGSILLAHKAQTDILHEEAEGKHIEVTVLFSHAQGTLMTTQSELFFVETLYELEMNRRKQTL